MDDSVFMAELSWPEFQRRVAAGAPVFLPLGSTEQHGPHLPLDTDSTVASLVCEALAARLAADGVDAVVAPAIAYGASGEHEDFPGTISIGTQALTFLLLEFGRSASSWAERIVFVNGHGGNIVPSQQATFELRQKYRTRNDLLLIATTYWTLGGKPWEAGLPMVQRRMGHACEYETSMMLRLNPHLVGDHAKVPDVDWGNPFDPASRAWTMKDRSEPGHVGFPKTASAEKGEILFRTFAADVVAMLERVIAWDGKSWEG
jgi:creatinine amidohydrolase